ncbi:dynein axonemal light chain 1 [Orycteropus afer afer]|uniref:Dynein axonemal light chain 1 n=1 Tax=Orycteropus afer afer TaxID=1230840 RepID=A0AC54Z7T7_ORYAF|nr:dynein axonemal light chain 1 [Orycteropus afer afer]
MQGMKELSFLFGSARRAPEPRQTLGPPHLPSTSPLLAQAPCSHRPARPPDGPPPFQPRPAGLLLGPPRLSQCSPLRLPNLARSDPVLLQRVLSLSPSCATILQCHVADGLGRAPTGGPMTTSLFSHEAATLTVPPHTGLADELLGIKVQGLGPGGRVTLRASAVSYQGQPTTKRTTAKATTIKEALARWEEKTGQKPSEAKEIKLYAQIPPIEKMDASLSTLANCEKLSLSTNCIEKIANLNGLKNLRILSLGRNNIKNLNGLEAVGDTLEELWISYNFIEKLKGIHVMKKLKILYMSNNLVKDWAEFVKLAELPCLEDLVFVGNPLEEKHSAEGNWIDEASKRVPRLKKLDGTPVIKEDEEEEN